jgi:hypothetical protein
LTEMHPILHGPEAHHKTPDTTRRGKALALGLEAGVESVTYRCAEGVDKERPDRERALL